MKQNRLIVAALLCAMFSFSSLNAQVNMNIRVGLTGGMFDVKPKQDIDIKVDPVFSICASAEVDLPFSLVFSFRTGLGIVQKAAETDWGNGIHADSVFSTVQRLTSLEVPLYLVARAETDYGNFYIGAGPTLSLGVGGQVIVAARRNNSTEIQREDHIKVKWDGKYVENTFHHFRRFDMGIGAFFTYQFNNGFGLTVNYNQGLRNLKPKEDGKLNASYFGVSIGFRMM